MSIEITISSDGVTSLRTLGIDYYYDEAAWEATYEAGDLERVTDWATDSGHGHGSDETYAISTLISGPVLHAIEIPISWSDNEPDDWEVRFFASIEDAQAARLAAIAEGLSR